MVPCNIGEINQVVLNLIVNGAHAIRDRMEEGQKGTIVVTTQHYPDAQCIVIAIADNGVEYLPMFKLEYLSRFLRLKRWAWELVKG